MDLTIGPDEQLALATLERMAAQNVFEVAKFTEDRATPADYAAHLAVTTSQRAVLPGGHHVSLIFESGHPCGMIRRALVSQPRADCAPPAEIVEAVALQLGFEGRINRWAAWICEMDGSSVVNVAQPIAPGTTGTAVRLH